MTAPITLLPGQSTTFSITPLDASGAAVPGTLPTGATVTYSSSMTSEVSITPNADGLTAVAKAVGAGPASGSAVITATLTFTDGNGNHSLSTSTAINVQQPVSSITSISMQNTPPA